ncbi:Hypp9555 [Branchiostoma lanceolatum]|uniref:Hypp9555 protein n=1 Tax=Branchiostoma lanceolatum TaxID=7740 RepID=A0A8S4MNB8_BRALA|nr:Hypp9555 [Branchiostoma lanceolatum]
MKQEEFEAFCDIDAGEECTGDPTEEEFSQEVRETTADEEEELPPLHHLQRTTSWIAKMTLSDSSNSDVSLDPDDIMPYRFEPRHELEEPHNTEEEAAVPGFAWPWNLAAVPMAVCRRC